MSNQIVYKITHRSQLLVVLLNQNAIELKICRTMPTKKKGFSLTILRIYSKKKKQKKNQKKKEIILKVREMHCNG